MAFRPLKAPSGPGARGLCAQDEIGYRLGRADYTAVIALNDDFEGRGMAVVDGLLCEWTLLPVPPTMG